MAQIKLKNTAQPHRIHKIQSPNPNKTIKQPKTETSQHLSHAFRTELARRCVGRPRVFEQKDIQKQLCVCLALSSVSQHFHSTKIYEIVSGFRNGVDFK